MIIDCDTCAMRHTSACDDCMVSALLGGAWGPVEIDAEEDAALRNLADAGLVAPLRLIRRTDDRAVGE